MLGKIFGFLCLISVSCTLIFGKSEELSGAVFSGCQNGVRICFSLLGMMAFWNGLMQVFSEGGILSRCVKIFTPLLRPIFPDAFEKNVAKEEIVSCLCANVLGMGNCATPLGIRAEELLAKASPSPIASGDMITLAVLSTVSFSIFPTTVLSLRQSLGATVLFSLLPVIWLVSFLGMTLGVMLCRLFAK